MRRKRKVVVCGRNVWKLCDNFRSKWAGLLFLLGERLRRQLIAAAAQLLAAGRCRGMQDGLEMTQGLGRSDQ